MPMDTVRALIERQFLSAHEPPLPFDLRSWEHYEAAAAFAARLVLGDDAPAPHEPGTCEDCGVHSDSGTRCTACRANYRAWKAAETARLVLGAEQGED